MRQVTPTWKLLTAILSLFLTILVWQQGLQESFSRPSVAPKLALKQQEMALLASPVLPLSAKPFLVGFNPEVQLKETLLAIPSDQIEDRERIILASLEESQDKRAALLEYSFSDQELSLIQKALLNDSGFLSSKISQLENLKKDALLYQVSCVALDGENQSCINKSASNSIALRLLGIQFFPIVATFLGLGLLLRQGWLLFKTKNISWPELSSLPLSLVDMTLLVSGGFVILGEVVLPAFALPLSSYLTNGFPSPINESLKVFIGYSVMTVAPLFILRQQINSLSALERPSDGWLQWRIIPINTAFIKAINGWLMIMPFVLITGLLMNFFVGDQGGSNPLLELVLRSNNGWALCFLLITTVVIAPAFEELIFRGTLLPVIARRFGRFGGITLSALIFALAHLSVGELPPLFVLGIGLGIMRVSSGRLFPCVIMHSLWNGITFFNLFLLGS